MISAYLSEIVSTNSEIHTKEERYFNSQTSGPSVPIYYYPYASYITNDLSQPWIRSIRQYHPWSEQNNLLCSFRQRGLNWPIQF